MSRVSREVTVHVWIMTPEPHPNAWKLLQTENIFAHVVKLSHEPAWAQRRRGRSDYRKGEGGMTRETER